MTPSGAFQTADTVLTEPGEVRRVRGILALRGMPPDASDDGVQTVRMKLIEQRVRGGPEAVRRPRAWIAVTASRVAADWHRDRARQRDLSLRLVERGAGAEASGDVVSEEVVATMQLAGALELLSEDHLEAVVLRYYADLTVRDIASTMQVPIGTVKSRLHSALAQLRIALSREDGVDDTTH